MSYELCKDIFSVKKTDYEFYLCGWMLIWLLTTYSCTSLLINEYKEQEFNDCFREA